MNTFGFLFQFKRNKYFQKSFKNVLYGAVEEIELPYTLADFLYSWTYLNINTIV